MNKYDVIIIGAGAAGLSAVATATNAGRRVLVLDMGGHPARKVAVSGGGRCNITNMAADASRYFGENPNFVRGAIARVTPRDILNWMDLHGLQYTEKAPGQYFCASNATDVVNALIKDASNADIKYNHVVKSVEKQNNEFIVGANDSLYISKSLIVASGGVSFGVHGVSDVGYKIAKHFGHKIVPVRPALCAMAIDNLGSELMGISIDCEITVGREKIRDALLFTHFGIGGPAVYRASVRDISNGIVINMCPDVNIYELLRAAKHTNGRRSITTILSEHIPMRLARYLCGNDTRNVADVRDAEIKNIADTINKFKIPGHDIRLHDLASAEIVRGGVSTDLISSKTMESKICPGLFFAGEVMDIAGDLGGFNLHWAWASGRIAGQNA